MFADSADSNGGEFGDDEFIVSDMRAYIGGNFLQRGFIMFCWDPRVLPTWHHTSFFLGSLFSLNVSASPFPVAASPGLLYYSAVVGICFRASHLSFLYLGFTNPILVHGLSPLSLPVSPERSVSHAGSFCIYIKQSSLRITALFHFIPDT